MSKKISAIALMFILLVSLSACAPGPNHNKDTRNADGEVAGFWMGTWHGMIMPFTFIGTWFSDDINIYEVHNSGVPYHFGLGLGGLIVNIFSIIMFMGRLQEMQQFQQFQRPQRFGPPDFY